MTVAVIAARWPAELHRYNDRYFGHLAGRLTASGDDATRTVFLTALFNAHWAPKDKFLIVSGFWVDLARLRLATGDGPGAAQAAGAITDPYDAVRLRQDVRFDDIVTTRPDHFDPAAMAERQLDQLETASSESPRMIEGPTDTAIALMTLGRNQEALTLIDGALEKASDPKVGEPYFVDLEDRLNWAQDTRARVLLRLGRYEEALAVERDAAAKPEDGNLNVNQWLNLADLYQRLGRPTDALRVTSQMIGRQMNEYGRATLEQIKVCAAVQLHDNAKVEEGLDYLRAHKADSGELLRDALLCDDREDEIATMLVRDIANPADRSEALFLLEKFDVPAGEADWEKTIRIRLDKIRQRPDIASAVAPVGHMESIHLNPPNG